MILFHILFSNFIIFQIMQRTEWKTIVLTLILHIAKYVLFSVKKLLSKNLQKLSVSSKKKLFSKIIYNGLEKVFKEKIELLFLFSKLGYTLPYSKYKFLYYLKPIKHKNYYNYFILFIFVR